MSGAIDSEIDARLSWRLHSGKQYKYKYQQLGGPYVEKATRAYKLTEGMAPPDLRAGLACDKLLQEIFSDNEVETRSQGLVEGVRSYMQTALRRLFERECEDCPALLKEIDTILVGEFIKTKENKTLEVVSNAIKTGLDWAFTLDPLYLETIAGVQEMVDSVRKKTHSLCSVGIVPGYFIDFMTMFENQREEFAIYKLQVSLAIYTDVVCKQLFDAVAKNVHYFLVCKICDGFTEWMMDKGTTANLKVWFAEDAEAKQTRVETERALAKFKEGLLLLETAGVSRSQFGINYTIPRFTIKEDVLILATPLDELYRAVMRAPCQVSRDKTKHGGCCCCMELTLRVSLAEIERGQWSGVENSVGSRMCTLHSFGMDVSPYKLPALHRFNSLSALPTFENNCRSLNQLLRCCTHVLVVILNSQFFVVMSRGGARRYPVSRGRKNPGSWELNAGLTPSASCLGRF
eukprot:jgi/Undpi1/12805/HiC_scaffold_7.g02472.m1